MALFASDDSQTAAELVPCCERGLRLDPAVTDYLAYAYLFPIDWPEPFGLTMAEAMATGTPVSPRGPARCPRSSRMG